MGSGGGGGGGTSVPEFNFPEAQKIVDKAYKEQQRVTEALYGRGELFEPKREISQAELGTLLTGRTAPEATNLYEQRFKTEIPKLTEEYATKQSTFEPGLLGGSSANLLANALRGSAQEYGRGMDEASKRSQARLYQTLAMPLAGFEFAAQSPAFNVSRNRVFMDLATRPPTVSTDVDSYKSQMTYNV